uniref:SH3 domain-containing protein n=1 Tax=Amphimedon queenslandica TaxID=400682 RepID=A0A1X7USV8_AMPQE
MATKSSSYSFPPSLFSSTLTIDQLIEVLNLLKRCGFPQRRWKKLGLTLGLHKNTLDAIKKDNDTTDDCLTECLSQWLSRADNVDRTGGATFDSLSDALKSMNENAAADKLDQEKRKAKAIDIFNTHHSLLSQSLSDPVSVAIMLQREGVITGQVLASVESASSSVPNQCEVLLAAILIAIQSKYSLLQTFASVLCKFTGNVKLGTVIQRDYDKVFNDATQVISDDEAQESSEFSSTDSNKSTSSVAPLYIPQYKSEDFDVLYAKFAKMFSNIRKVISQSPPPLKELKTFIEDFNSDLEVELSSIKNQEGVMRLIRKNCSLINIVILEAVVEHFEIDDAQKYIDDYKREVKEFCCNLSVDLCLNEPFDVVRASPLLKCETATYVLGWEATEHKLKDVTDIVSKSSGKFMKLINIKSTHSITITCSFPHSLTGALIIKLSENLELLIKNGLMKLTVGYCTIWKKQKIQEIQEPLEEEVQEIKEQPHDTKEERVARLEVKEAEGATPQSVINQDMLSTDTSVTIINRQLIKELKTNKQLKETLTKIRVKEIQQLLSLAKETNSTSYRIRRGMRMEIEQLQLLLTNKAGLMDQNKSLIDIKREIAELQEQISLMSVHLLNKREENEEYRNLIRINKPTAKSVFIARYGFHATMNGRISFSDGEQLEIYEKWNSFWWKGRSLVSGVVGVIPSSCVYSMLESFQLLEFILSVEEVSLPILQKIRNDSSSNDEKASLFLETINDDPIMIPALRQDKEQHDKGVIGRVDWGSDRVSLYSPSSVQCNEVIGNINDNYKKIDLHSSSTNSTVSLLSSTKLHTLNLSSLEIWYTPLTNDCIQYLCILLTNNKTIQELGIKGYSVSDRGVTNICQALKHNSTLTSLDLYCNPLITSTSGHDLSHLLLNNSSLVKLDLRSNSLSTESILLILQSLMDKNIRRLILDERHKGTCINTYPNYHLIKDRVYWW